MRSRLVVTAMLILTALGTKAHVAAAERGKIYNMLAVRAFEGEAGDEMPIEFREELRASLIKELHKSGRFQNVVVLKAGQEIPTGTDIILSGTVLKFKEGSRAARYMVPGVGSTSIKASIEFVDAASEATLMKREVGGRVSFGLFGGDSKGAMRGMAAQLAKECKKRLP